MVYHSSWFGWNRTTSIGRCSVATRTTLVVLWKKVPVPVGDNGGAAMVWAAKRHRVSSSGSPQQLTHVRRGSD